MKYLSQIPIESYFNSPIGKTGGEIGDLVSLFLKGSLTLAGFVVLVFFILAGISMIAGAGEGSPEKAEKAKKFATNAVVGFVIIFVAYWIIRIIEVMIGVSLITEPGL